MSFNADPTGVVRHEVPQDSSQRTGRLNSQTCHKYYLVPSKRLLTEPAGISFDLQKQINDNLAERKAALQGGHRGGGGYDEEGSSRDEGRSRSDRDRDRGRDRSRDRHRDRSRDRKKHRSR